MDDLDSSRKARGDKILRLPLIPALAVGIVVAFATWEDVTAWRIYGAGALTYVLVAAILSLALPSGDSRRERD